MPRQPSNESNDSNDLPSGLVTFVFTDIEGSTRLFRRLGDDYAEVLRRHQHLLRQAWRDHGGHEVTSEGDSFLVSFSDPAAAIRAAADAQRALQTEWWPVDAELRVRIGIHSGLASPNGGQYVAMAVHQASRIVDAAHGGQILVSAHTVRALASPVGLSLISLGLFRVRDFDEPLELFRVGIAGLVGGPAPRVLPADRHNLLRPLAEFIDREEDIAALPAAIRAGHAVTLVGPGGVGKTRLAIECGFRLVDRWPEGVWFVDLAVVEDPSLVARTVASALGLHVPSDADPVSYLANSLATRPALLIIDNAEHVREATAHLVTAVLQRCPSTAVLTTSRERLGVPGETVCRLGPLPTHRRHQDAGRDPPAVRLFCRRAKQSNPTWLPQNMDEIVELCQRLDGLPLAIEMAAARTSAFSLSEILSGVGARSSRLASDDPTVGARHRSLEHLLQWSDDLLSDDERAVFHRLGVFSGTFSHDLAIAAVGRTGTLDADTIPEMVWSLVNKSLVNVEPAAGATRYRLLGTVRAFARQSCGHTETVATARRLARWYLERIGPGMPLDLIWTGRMGDEIDNVRGLVPTLAESDCSTAQRLACSIGQYLDLTQAYSQGIDEVDRYTRLLTEPTPERVGLLTRLADLRMRVGDLGTASAALQDAVALQRQVGPAPWDEVSVERSDGELALRSGEYERAAGLAEQMLGRDISRFGQGRMWNLLGIARISAGDAAGAAVAFEREIDSWKQVGREALLVSAHGNLAEALIRVGDRQRAAQHQLVCLELAVQYGQPLMVAYSAMVAARFAGDDGDWATATRLQTAADRELHRIGHMMYPADRAAAEAMLAEAEMHLGPAEFAAGRASMVEISALVADTTDVLQGVRREEGT